MADSSPNFVLLFKKHLETEKTPPMPISIKENEVHNILEKINTTRQEINSAYKKFSALYQRNNIYGLFKVSEEFYTRSVQLIHFTETLFKNHFIQLKMQDALMLIDNISLLMFYIQKTKVNQEQWLSKSSLKTSPGFLPSLNAGNKQFQKLEYKVQRFFMIHAQIVKEAETKKSSNVTYS